jgi:DNA-binding XRE family transcriptional regulator
MKTELTKLDNIKDRFIGPIGSDSRSRYEATLTQDIVGDFIRQARRERKLTQSQLGDLIGVQKAQISKLESNAGNMTLATILRVFKALNAEVRLAVDLDDENGMQN